MAEVVKPYKIGNYWTNLIDSESGESVNFEEVTEWLDGTPMDDSKCDGYFFRKLPLSVGGGYVKRIQDEVLIQTKPDDPVYNRTMLQLAIDFLEGGFSDTSQIRRSGGKLLISEGKCPIDQPLIPKRRGLIIEGMSRGTVIFPSNGFPSNRALIQSRNIADRGGTGSGPFTSCTVKNLTLCGVDPDIGDFSTPNNILGIWFSRMDAQGAPFGIENVKFRALKEGIRGTRLYGLTVNKCTFEGGTNSAHWGIALNFNQSEQGGEADDAGGVRAFYCSDSQFVYLSQVITSQYGYGYGFSGIRVENCTPSEDLTEVRRAVFTLLDARGWVISGGSYFENINYRGFMCGGTVAGGPDDCYNININDCIIFGQSGTFIEIRGLHDSTIQDNYWGTPGTRLDFRFISGVNNIVNNIFEKGAGSLGGSIPNSNVLETRSERVEREKYKVERISNANGECIRYSNGWQVCTRTVTLDLTITTAQQFQWAANFTSPQAGDHIFRSFTPRGNSSQRAEYSKISGLMMSTAEYWTLAIQDTGGATGSITVQLRAEGPWQ